MNSEELKKLRQFYHSLVGLNQIFAGFSGGNFINHKALVPLERELLQLEKDFPGLVPPFNKGEYHEERDMYNFTAIRTHLVVVLGRLQIAIEQPTGVPVTEKRQFTFVTNPDLRAIIERDYTELQKAYISECWKSVIILCGGAIETILTDLLIQNETAAKAAKAAPKKPDLASWDLSDLITVAVELSLVSAGVEKLSHSIREYRNLVHPGKELRSKLRFDTEEARIAVEVLNIVHRDLSH